MKFLTKLLIVFLFITSSVFAAHQLYADSENVTIPYGTKLELYISHDLTTKNLIEGDMFQSYLIKDIYVNNKLILPSNTVFRGRVSKIKYSRSLSRPATLYLTLDHLVTKTGVQLPISAGIASDFEYVLKSDGGLTTNGNYFRAVKEDVKKSGQIVSKSVNWGKTTGDNLFNGAKYVIVPVAALGGGLACVGSSVYSAIADLFRHGDEIVIKKGTQFNILLLSKLDIPS